MVKKKGVDAIMTFDHKGHFQSYKVNQRPTIAGQNA